MNGMYGERALRISHRCFLHGMTQNLMILIKLSRSDQRILILPHRYRRMRAWYFLDPVYRQIQFENDEDGKPAGKYPDVIHGIRVTEDNSIEVNLLHLMQKA